MIFASIVFACAIIAMFPITIGQCTTTSLSAARSDNITSVPAPRSIASRKGNHRPSSLGKHRSFHQWWFYTSCAIRRTMRRSIIASLAAVEPPVQCWRLTGRRRVVRIPTEAIRVQGLPALGAIIVAGCSRKKQNQTQTLARKNTRRDRSSTARPQHKFMFVHLHLHNSPPSDDRLTSNNDCNKENAPSVCFLPVLLLLPSMKNISRTTQKLGKLSFVHYIFVPYT